MSSKKNWYERKRVALVSDPSKNRVQQHAKSECDINKIIARHRLTGQYYAKPGTRLPQYLDCTQVQDYATMRQIVIDAQDEFERLPAKIRAMFNNDVSTCLEYISKPENIPNAVALGLLEPQDIVTVPELVPEPAPTGANINQSPAGQPGNQPAQ